MDKDTEKKISQLQLLEQGMQNFQGQKQQLQSKFLEFDSALEELDKTEICYKIIGNIMVRVNKEELKKQLQEDKKKTTIRIETLEKQEASMREKAKKLQQDVMKQMEK